MQQWKIIRQIGKEKLKLSFVHVMKAHGEEVVQLYNS